MKKIIILLEEFGYSRLVLKLFAILGAIYMIYSASLFNGKKIDIMFIFAIIFPIGDLFFSHYFFIMKKNVNKNGIIGVGILFGICFIGSACLSSSYMKNRENMNYNKIKINSDSYKQNKKNEEINIKIKENLINNIRNKNNYNIQKEVLKDPRVLVQQNIIKSYPLNYITLRNQQINKLNQIIKNITKEYQEINLKRDIDNNTLNKLLNENQSIKNHVISSYGILSQAQSLTQIIYGSSYTENNLNLILTILCLFFSCIFEILIIGFNILDPKKILNPINKKKEIIVNNQINQDQKIQFVLDNLKLGEKKYVKIKQIQDILKKNGIEKNAQYISKLCIDNNIEMKMSGGYKKYLVNIDNL